MRYPRLLIFQYWIHALRLGNAIAGLVVAIAYHMDLTVGRYPYGNGMPEAALLLVTCSLLIINDVFMLTFDCTRTGTYLGSVAAQGGISILSLIIASIALRILGATWEKKIDWWPQWFNVWAVLLSCLANWSLGLLGSLLWVAQQLFRQPSSLGCQYLWLRNTKDLFSGPLTTPNKPHISLTGHPRDRDVPILVKAGALKRFAIHLLFRRISPAETKLHAAIQNISAMIFMIVIIFRAVTVFSQAGNEFETRLRSEPCPTSILAMGYSYGRPDLFQILVERPYYWAKLHDMEVSVNATSYGRTLAYSQSDLETSSPELPIFGAFSCPEPSSYICWYPDTYNIVSHFPADAMYTPDLYSLPLWLSSQGSHSDPRAQLRSNNDTVMNSVVPWYLPPWQIRPGFHYEGETGFILRRFIISSAWRDLITNKKPKYAEIWLYPITTSYFFPIADKSVATATIRLRGQSRFTFLRDQQAFQAAKRGNNDQARIQCDVIEDYRAGTVLDALGSVGGLFALLQAIHILLFGRPLFWGLSGAKLISPFGLFGMCASRGFKRRLREQYRRQPTADNSDAIQIGTFLRDFVIDFGPAEVELDQESLSSPERKLVPDNDRTESMAMGNRGLKRASFTSSSQGAFDEESGTQTQFGNTF